MTIYKLKTTTIKINVSDSATEKSEIRRVSNPTDALKIAYELYKTMDDDQEHTLLLSMDAKNNIKAFKFLSSGSQNSAEVDPKIVFRTALLLGASAIILIHNHPSGDPAPSVNDKSVTQRISSIAKDIDIYFHDHIILGKNGNYYSFKQSGFLEAHRD